jgi:prepilin-type N-terminal cleavage/methylation domain-containing protein
MNDRATPSIRSERCIRFFRRPERAFALIELIVVVAVLGILAALLLPVFGKAKNQAVEAVDMNNLKQIMTAIHVYTGENHDILPAPNWLSQDKSGHSGWLYTLNTSASGPQEFQFTGGLIWPTLKEPSLYMCPMDNTNSSLFKQRDQQLSSYAMNGATVGYMRTNFPAETLAAMRPDDVALWETDERHPNYFNDGANIPSEGVSPRHLNGAIDATFGGSVSYIRLNAWYVQVNDPNKNSLWCYPGSNDGR